MEEESKQQQRVAMGNGYYEVLKEAKAWRRGGRETRRTRDEEGIGQPSLPILLYFPLF